MGAADYSKRAGRSAPAAQAQMGHIFISYARADSWYVDYVERMFTAWGYRVWMDRQQLGGGENWTVELQHAIETSAALVLILTPAALRSPMVRREYSLALARGIPVVIARRRSGGALPPELAHAQVIDLSNRLQATAALYFALTDLGLEPSPPMGELDLMSSAATAPVALAVMGRRTPTDWLVSQAPAWSYWWRLLGRFALLFAASSMFNIVPPAWLSFGMRMQVGSWAINSLTPVLLVLVLLYAAPGMLYVFILRGIVPREMIVLTPDSCVVSLLRAYRMSIVVSSHRYMYQWATSAEIRRDRLGGVHVMFLGVRGERAVLRLPWYIPKRRAIAQHVVEAVAALSRQSAVETRAATETSLTVAQSSAAVVVPAPQWYAFLAPDVDRALVASVQAWLGPRGVLPVEMAWSRGQGGVLAPTERGAAHCRFALFADTPAITRDQRWRAVLFDLQRRGATLIPVRTQAKPPTQSEWSSLQWVDFTKGVATDRGLLGLCDTLDRHGLLPTQTPTPNQPFLDTDLALARATYQRLPPGWMTFAGELALQSTRLRRRRRRERFAMLAVGAAAVAIVMVSVLALFNSTSQKVATVLIGIGALMVGAVTYQIFSLLRARAELVRDQTIQERLIIAPEGVVFHFMNQFAGEVARRMLLRRFALGLPQSEILHGSALFAQIRAIEGRSDWLGTRTLRLDMADGRTITLPLRALGPAAELAVERAREAFRAYLVGRDAAADVSASRVGP